RAIAEVRDGGPTAAVFYIDLDHFKDVNDTLGHHIGDELIINVTERLGEIVNDDDLVARLGGDEFAIIMTCASDSYSLQAITERILGIICAPFVLNGHSINIGASIGIAVIDSCSRTPATSCVTPIWRSIAPRAKAATGRASTMPRWTPISRTANCWKARSVKRSEIRSCTSSISRSSIQGGRGWPGSRGWPVGFIPSRAKYRQGVSFRLRSIPA